MTGYSTSLVYVAYTVNYKLDEQQDRDIRKKNLGVPNSRSINESGHCQNN